VKDCTTTRYGCCPDLYTTMTRSDGSDCPGGTGPYCYNILELGLNSEICSIKNPADFKSKHGESALCAQQKYAQTCKITWDGVTNIPSGC
jgi:hypothetical protein